MSTLRPVAHVREWWRPAGLVLDMDGVLWLGGRALPGIDALFTCLERRGLPFVLATNNATRLPQHWVARMAELGVPVAAERVVTSAVTAARFAAARYPQGTLVYAIGEEGLLTPLLEAGFPLMADAERPVAAVVVGYDSGLTYAKLRDAALLLGQGADFIATNGDVTFPSERGPIPGVGASLAALSAATGRSPEVVGKPERAMFDLAATTLGLAAETLLMVGDRLDTDIAGARRAGLMSVLVTTGIHDAPDAAACAEPPDAVVSGLDALAAALCGGD